MAVQMKTLQVEVKGDFKVEPFVENAEKYQITVHEDVAIGHAAVRGIKDLRAEIKGSYKKIKDPLNEALTALRAEERRFTDPLDKAELIIRGKFDTWHLKCDLETKAENERIAEKARKERDKLIERATAKADKLIAGNEDISEQIKTLRFVLEENQLSEIEQEIIAGRIELLEAKLTQSAEAIRQKQEDLDRSLWERVTVAPPVKTIKTKGVGKVKKRIVAVRNVNLLLKAILDGRVPIHVLSVNQTKLNAFANLSDSAIPGCDISVQYSTRIR